MLNEKETNLIDNYLRLVQAGDLSHLEICEIIKVDTNQMLAILNMKEYSQYITSKLNEFRMTNADIWNRVDLYIGQGFNDEYISYFLDIPLNQIRFRRRFLEKKII